MYVLRCFFDVSWQLGFYSGYNYSKSPILSKYYLLKNWSKNLSISQGMEFWMTKNRSQLPVNKIQANKNGLFAMTTGISGQKSKLAVLILVILLMIRYIQCNDDCNRTRYLGLFDWHLVSTLARRIHAKVSGGLFGGLSKGFGGPHYTHHVTFWCTIKLKFQSHFIIK